MSTWNDEQQANWIVFGLALALGLFWAGVHLFGPCSWMMWEPISDIPSRCLPGLTR